MRILHTESSLGWGGQELRSVLEVKLLARIGHTAIIAASQKSQFSLRSGLEPDQMSFAEIDKKNLRGLFEAFRILKLFKPDVLVTHSSTDSWLFTIARWILRLRCGLIRVRHVRADVGSNFATRWLYSRPHFVVTTSEDIREHLISRLRLEPDRVISIPTGIDVARFITDANLNKKEHREKLGVSTRSRLVMMVSTLRSWKGHDIAISAMRKISDHTLVVVGDGPRESHLRKMVEELGLSGRIIFVGFSPEVENLLAIADVFLQPSLRHEGVSQSLIQAGAIGLPVVVSNIGGLNEVVQDGVTGLVVAPGSVEELVVAIRRFESDAQLADACGNNLKSSIHAGFTQELMIERMEAIYRLAAR